MSGNNIYNIFINSANRKAQENVYDFDLYFDNDAESFHTATMHSGTTIGTLSSIAPYIIISAINSIYD